MEIRIDTRTLTPDGFGIEVSGFDMSRLDDQSGQVLTQAFLDYGGLLVLRDQALENPNDLRQFTALFGEVERSEKYDPRYLLPDYPEILRIGNTMENGQYSALFIRADLPLYSGIAMIHFVIHNPWGHVYIAYRHLRQVARQALLGWQLPTKA